jgi:uncharacterized RDD family membrane protein YckC
MLSIGGEKLIAWPLYKPTLYSARYYIALWSFGFLYFSITEGIWGGGLGKYLKGLRVVRTNGRPAGFGRALIRILIPIGLIEGIRNPLNMVLISDADWTWIQIVIYVVTANACAWIPVLFTLRARRENGFATLWDLFTGTRVVIKPRSTVRPSIKHAAQPEIPADTGSLKSWFPENGLLLLIPCCAAKSGCFGEIRWNFPLLDEILPGPAVCAGCRRSKRVKAYGTPLRGLKECRFPVL